MNAQQIWQAQATEAPRLSLAYVRHRAGTLERHTRWRNALEYGTGVVAFGLFVFSAYQERDTGPVMVAAMGWFALWCLYYMYRWHRLAAVAARPSDAGLLDSLRYQRRQLERQRDVRYRSWRWWGPSVLPGFGLFFTSMVMEQNPIPWNELAFAALWATAGVAIAISFLEAEARRLQREIEALDSLASD
jgi:hypothetical protein